MFTVGINKWSSLEPFNLIASIDSSPELYKVARQFLYYRYDVGVWISILDLY